MTASSTIGMVTALTLMLASSPRIAAEPAATPRFEWMVDGVVSVTARVGNALYVGGTFQHAIPPSGVHGRLYAVSPSTGAFVPSSIPRVDVPPRAMLPDGGGGYYLHGNFTIGTGNAVGRVVHIRPDGSVDPLFNSPPNLTGGGVMVRVGPNPDTGAVDVTWAANQQAPAGFVSTLASDGTTVFACGTFTAFDGQPRSRLAAVDVATGALLPWSPQASHTVERVVVSPTGTVLVSGYDFRTGQGTVNGQMRTGGLFEIDGTGALTSFQLQVTTDQAAVMLTAGALIVGGAPAYSGAVARQSLAAFDLTTGALLPFDAAILGVAGAERPGVWALTGHDQVLHIRGVWPATIGGQARVGAASVDAVTGAVLPAWSTPGLVVDGIGPYHGGWLYLSTRPAGGSSLAPSVPRRLDPVTRTLDPAWLPPAMFGAVVVDRGELLFLGGLSSGGGFINGTFVGTLDGVTGQLRELFQTTAYLGWKMIVDGDTLYVQGTDPATVYGGFDSGRTVYAYDRQTGVPVRRPPLTGRINDFVIADGRFVVGGRNVHAGAVERYGLMELSRTGTPTAWDPGFTPHGPPGTPGGGAPGGVSEVAAYGNVLVAAGASGPDVTRVAVFDLSGSTAPSGLRSRSAAGVVEFAWDAPATPPAGGYVLEGAFAPGQTAASLPVGTGTTFATPLSVIGPAYIRVRGQGSTDVSNEIVVGCVAPPQAPTALITTMNGTDLTLTWSAPIEPVSTYTFSAGTASGLSDAARFPLPGTQTSIGGTVPGGTFFVRVSATNACGSSGPSGEVFMTIGAPDPLPAAPMNVAASVSASTVTLTWTPPAGPVTGYVLEGGTSLGLANIGAVRVGTATSFAIPGAPPGTYYVRVRAVPCRSPVGRRRSRAPCRRARTSCASQPPTGAVRARPRATYS